MAIDPDKRYQVWMVTFEKERGSGVAGVWSLSFCRERQKCRIY
jgi:hypothetical protein